MKTIKYLSLLILSTLVIVFSQKVEASVNTDFNTVIDPILPKKKSSITKRFFKKLNPFRKSKPRKVYAPRVSPNGPYGVIPNFNTGGSSNRYGTYGPVPTLPGTRSQIYDKVTVPSTGKIVGPNGPYGQIPPARNTNGYSLAPRLYDKVPPIYDKVPPIYDKVPPLGQNTYSKLPGLKEVFANNKANTLKVSSSKLLPMHATMNQKALQKSKTMGAGTMNAAQRGAFIKELQTKQKAMQIQKRKAYRAERMRQGRELIKYAQNPAAAKPSRATKTPLPKASSPASTKTKALPKPSSSAKPSKNLPGANPKTTAPKATVKKKEAQVKQQSVKKKKTRGN